MFDCFPIKQESSILLLLSSGANQKTLRLSLNKIAWCIKSNFSCCVVRWNPSKRENFYFNRF